MGSTLFRIMTLAIALSFVGSVPAVMAQENVRVDFQQAGWSWNSAHGEGVGLIFMASEMPAAGLAAFESGLLMLCNQVAPEVVPLVLEEQQKSDPDFVSVTIRSGNAFFGTSISDFFTFQDGMCRIIE
jgi:hypothetical protein